MRKDGANVIHVEAGETKAFQTAMVVGSRAECVYTYNKGECLDASSVGVMYNSVIYYKVGVMYDLVIYYKVEVIGAECLDTKKVECLDARRNVNAEFLDAGSRAECVDTYSKGECLDASSNVEIKNEANRVGGLLRGPSGHNGVGGGVGRVIVMDIMVADIGMIEVMVADIGILDIKVAKIGMMDIMICSQGTTYGTFPVRTMWVEGAGAFR